MSLEPAAAITLTGMAHALLARFFKGQDPAPMRLEYAEGGCAGPRLQLRLAETPAAPEDVTVTVEGYQFVADRALLAAASPLTIDATRLAFVIQSALRLEAGGCQSCSGCAKPPDV